MTVRGHRVRVARHIVGYVRVQHVLVYPVVVVGGRRVAHRGFQRHSQVGNAVSPLTGRAGGASNHGFAAARFEDVPRDRTCCAHDLAADFARHLAIKEVETLGADTAARSRPVGERCPHRTQLVERGEAAHHVEFVDPRASFRVVGQVGRRAAKVDVEHAVDVDDARLVRLDDEVS